MLHSLLLFFEYIFSNGVMNCCLSGYVHTIPDSSQPPPQAEASPKQVTGDEPQGNMGRGTDGRRSAVSPVVSFPPSFAHTFLSKERRLGTRQG